MPSSSRLSRAHRFHSNRVSRYDKRPYGCLISQSLYSPHRLAHPRSFMFCLLQTPLPASCSLLRLVNSLSRVPHHLPVVPFVVLILYSFLTLLYSYFTLLVIHLHVKTLFINIRKIVLLYMFLFVKICGLSQIVSFIMASIVSS